jgi:hypothetical protein
MSSPTPTRPTSRAKHVGGVFGGLEDSRSGDGADGGSEPTFANRDQNEGACEMGARPLTETRATGWRHSRFATSVAAGGVEKSDATLLTPISG